MELNWGKINILKVVLEFDVNSISFYFQNIRRYFEKVKHGFEMQNHTFGMQKSNPECVNSVLNLEIYWGSDKRIHCCFEVLKMVTV